MAKHYGARLLTDGEAMRFAARAAKHERARYHSALADFGRGGVICDVLIAEAGYYLRQAKQDDERRWIPGWERFGRYVRARGYGYRPRAD
jgi:hypothetical protein